MLKIKEYRKTVKRPYPPMQSFLFLKGFANTKYYKPFFNRNYKLDEVIIAGDAWHCSDRQLDHIGELTLELWKTKNGFLKTKKLFLEREKKLLSSKNKNLAFFAEAFQAYQPAVLMISYSEKMLEDFIRKLLLKKAERDKVDELMDALNNPLEDNIYRREELELINTKDLKGHVRKYSGLYSRYGEDRPYTLKEAKLRLKRINKDKLIEDYNNQKKKIRRAIQESKKIIGERWSHMVDVMQFSVYYRTHRADILHLATYNFIPQFKQLAKSLKLSYGELLNCTSEEILAKNIPSQNIIEARIKEHGFIMEKGKIKLIIGSEYKKINEYFAEKNINTDAIKGITAQNGIIKGKVKIVYNLADYKKFKVKQVLVTSMTTPDMVPLMKRSSAIITDEGGITCHAAIISRELKKPCVIGTKIATQVLKDGDMVEVDAYNGVIKIIK